MSLSSFYVQALKSKEELPQPLETAILRYALNSSEARTETLLIAFAERDILNAPAKKAIMRSNSARVKAAYFSRSDLPASEIEEVLLKEKRATILSALASLENASDELLIALSANARPTVNKTLLNRSNLPAKALVNVIVNLSPSYDNLNYDDEKKFIKAKNDLVSKGYADALIEKIENPSSLISLLTDASSKESALKIIETIILPSFKDESDVRKTLNSFTASKHFLMSQSFEGETFVSTLAVETLEIFNRFQLKGPYSYPRLDLTTDELEVIKYLSGDKSEREKARVKLETFNKNLKIASTSNDFDELSDLIDSTQMFTSQANQRNSAQLIEALVKNDNMPLKIFEKISPFLRYHVAVEKLKSLLPKASNSYEYSLWINALAAAYQPLSDAFKITDIADRSEYAVTAFKISEQKNIYYFTAEEQMTFLDLMSDEQILSLQWSSLSQLPSNRIASLVASNLGDDQSVWEIFEVLAENFAGDFGSLLSSVVEL